MRQIKFRVYAPLGKKFLYSYKNRGLAFSASREDSAMEQCGCYDLEQCVDYGFIIQQFTGLLDKNGKEIHEADIVEYNSWTTGSYGSKFTGEVKFGEETAGFSIFNKEDGTEQILWRDEQDYLTVIGNIFENPELCAK
jgi:uncharacterized phage protein (TIGR01671 family)